MLSSFDNLVSGVFEMNPIAMVTAASFFLGFAKDGRQQSPVSSVFCMILAFIYKENKVGL